MRSTLITVILIGFCLPALAVGKVTTDPNTAGASAPNEEVLQGTDARLAAKVTISDAKTPVWKILDQLTKSSGVVLKAGSGSYDWQVRDRKMNIFAKDVPLVQLMNSISHVMKFKWERKGDPGRGDAASPHASVPGKWTYRLYMDRRTLLDAEAQRARAEEKEAAEQTKKRQNALDTFGKLSSMTDKEKAKLKDDNPFLYAVSQLGWGDALGAFFREVPAVSEALASGQKISLEGSSLTAAGRQNMIKAMQSEINMENRFDGNGGGNRSIPTNLDPSKVSLVINDGLDRMQPPVQGVFLGEVNFRYDGGQLSAPFLNPDSNLVKWVGKMILQAEQSNTTLDEAIKGHESEMASMLTQEAKAESQGEPETQHPDDPALQVKVKLQPESPALYNVEMDLAQASKLCIVSDYFPSMNWGGMRTQGPPSGEMELKTALEKIGDSFIYNWDKRDGIIELRDRSWFRKRALQIPDAWLEKWREELKNSGTIDIDSLAQIAQLTQEQFNANVLSDDDLRQTDLMGTVTSGRELLRFYASLTPDQRSALSSQSGLDVTMLSQDQSDQFNKLIDTRSLRLSPGKAAVMTRERAQVNKTYIYNFRLDVNGETRGDWSVSTAESFKPEVPAVKKTPPPAKPAKQ